MMQCKKCSMEIPEQSQFCSHCGFDLSVNTEKTEENKKFKQNQIFKLLAQNKLIAGGISFAVFLLISAFLMMVFFKATPAENFINFINKNNYTDAVEVYNQKIKGNTERENQFYKQLEITVNRIYDDFKKQKISYEEAKTKFETIKKTGVFNYEIDLIIRQTNELYESKNSYKKAQEFKKTKKYYEALSELHKVVKDDANYPDSQNEINRIKATLKNEEFFRIDEMIQEKKYEEALDLIEKLWAVVPNDEDLLKKEADCKKLFEEAKAQERLEKMKEAEKEQLLTVDSAKIYVQNTEYKTLYPDLIQVKVKNKLKKTVKSFEVSCLGYDQNGYPKKIKTYYSFSGGEYEEGDYEYVAVATDANILPGETFGGEYGWKLDQYHDLSKILACVKTAVFYDGTLWENPYYEYWLETYKEKPLN